MENYTIRWGRKVSLKLIITSATIFNLRVFCSEGFCCDLESQRLVVFDRVEGRAR